MQGTRSKAQLRQAVFFLDALFCAERIIGFLQIDDGDVGTLFCEMNGHRFADAGIGLR